MKTWKDIEELAEKEQFLRILEEEGNSRRIADRLGCSQESVKNAMRHHSLRSKCFVVRGEMKKKLKL